MKHPELFLLIVALLPSCGMPPPPTLSETATPPPAAVPTPTRTPMPTQAPTPTRAPIRVAPTSYDNAKTLAIGPQKLPVNPYSGVAHAFADFRQNGTLELFIATIEYDMKDPGTFGDRGHFWFYVSQPDGSYSRDRTLLADDTGCLHPRKAIVADFNGDSYPDLMVGCTGLDVVPFPGEQSAFILSQPDGTYATTWLDFSAYAHGVAAGDVTGDGLPDVVMTDTSVQHIPFFLVNNGDGTFTRRFDILPAYLKDKLLYTVELIDFNQDNLLDVFLAGHNWVDNGSCPCVSDPIILINDGSGTYRNAARMTLPPIPGEGVTLDIVYLHPNIYLLHTSGGDGTFYQSTVIQRVQYPDLESAVVYSTRRPFAWEYAPATPYGGLFPWTPWIVPYQGNIVSTSSVFSFVVGQ
jgi:hypothetical protein